MTNETALREAADMEAVGNALMDAIEKDFAGHPFMKNWHPADCPSEIVGDLLNALDEAMQSPSQPVTESLATKQAREVMNPGFGSVSAPNGGQIYGASQPVVAEAVANARQAVEELANTRMDMPLERWSELSSTILAALVDMRNPMTDKHINWLVHALEAWPGRPDPKKTANITYLMQEAAKVIRDLSKPTPVEAGLRDAMERFARDLENADFDNVAFALNQRMCCNGQMCGCQGSTVGQYLAYELRSALPTAGALDWRRVAKLAGQFGIRYRTNTALEQFLAALSETQPPRETSTETKESGE